MLIKENMIKYLYNKDLFTFACPVEDDRLLNKLDNVNFSNLQPNFISQLSEIKKKIINDTFPKKIYGKKLTGPSLANLLILFIENINKGTVPNFNTM